MMTAQKRQLRRLEKATLQPGLAQKIAYLRAAGGGKSLGMKGAEVSADLVHLLNRTSFGPTDGELELAQALGYEAYLEYQLGFESIDNAFLEDLLADLFPSLALSYSEIFENLENDQEFEPASELIVATIARQLFSPRQLFEVVTEFWTNHFNVFLLDGPVQYLKTVDDRENIRPFAMTSFGDLLRADARSPSMLYYLDNFSNTKFGPNENYARELMELHTLGVDGGYTETDVIEVARCFTGWTIDPRTADLFVFEQAEHDTDAKQVLGQVIDAGDIRDGEQVLDLLLEQSATGQFLATKLCRRFIADTPPASIVNEVAAVYASTAGDIKSMLRTLFLSDEFRGSASQKFRRPSEYVTHVVRTLDPVESDDYFQVMFRQLENLGQIPYFAVPPTGYGDEAKHWLNTNALLGRWNVAFAIAFGDLPAGSRVNINDDNPRPQRVMADFFQLRIFNLLGSARTPAEIVDQLLSQVVRQQVGQEDRQAFIAHAANGGSATAPLDLSQAVERARAVLATILASRHFQNR